jgi:hypothetical protein
MRGSENPAFLAKLAENRNLAQHKASSPWCLVVAEVQAAQGDSVQ